MQKHCTFVLGGHFADQAIHFHWKIQYNSLFLRRKGWVGDEAQKEGDFHF